MAVFIDGRIVEVNKCNTFDQLASEVYRLSHCGAVTIDRCSDMISNKINEISIHYSASKLINTLTFLAVTENSNTAVQLLKALSSRVTANYKFLLEPLTNEALLYAFIAADNKKFIFDGHIEDLYVLADMIGNAFHMVNPDIYTEDDMKADSNMVTVARTYVIRMLTTGELQSNQDIVKELINKPLTEKEIGYYINPYISIIRNIVSEVDMILYLKEATLYFYNQTITKSINQIAYLVYNEPKLKGMHVNMSIGTLEGCAYDLIHILKRFDEAVLDNQESPRTDIRIGAFLIELMSWFTDTSNVLSIPNQKTILPALILYEKVLERVEIYLAFDDIVRTVMWRVLVDIREKVNTKNGPVLSIFTSHSSPYKNEIKLYLDNKDDEFKMMIGEHMVEFDPSTNVGSTVVAAYQAYQSPATEATSKSKKKEEPPEEEKEENQDEEPQEEDSEGPPEGEEVNSDEENEEDNNNDGKSNEEGLYATDNDTKKKKSNIEATQSTKGYKKSSKVVSDGSKKIYSAYKKYKSSEEKIDSQLSKMVSAAKNAFAKDAVEEVIDGKTYSPIGILKKALKTAAIFSGNKIAGIAYLVATHTISKKRSEKQKRMVLAEIEAEIEMLDEKIEDAKGDGNRKAKYALMRTRGELKRTQEKIKYNLTATVRDVKSAKDYLKRDQSRFDKRGR